MASTATNKQPLLVDRVFHEVVKTDTLASGSADSVAITGTNSAAVLLNCQSNDGAICETIYAVSRIADDPQIINLYFSNATDYLRPDEATFIGQFVSSTDLGQPSEFINMPLCLTPPPRITTISGSAKNNALYVPKGKVLWVTLQRASSANINTQPVVATQGGYY